MLILLIVSTKTAWDTLAYRDRLEESKLYVKAQTEFLSFRYEPVRGCCKDINLQVSTFTGPCIANVFSSTGLFVSSSGISELDCATTKTDTAERSISIGRESLQVLFYTRGLGVLPGSTARG